MGDLTKNLSRHEFKCKGKNCGENGIGNCGFDTVDFGLPIMIQDGADHFAKEYDSRIIVDITGGNRCKEHNETVQKEANKNYVPYSSKSTHMDAKGADHKFYFYDNGTKAQIPPLVVYDY